MPQLDGLRTLAVLTVMSTHWLPPSHPLNLISKWGTVGIYLFFVLSGYLITGILLKSRLHVDSGGISRLFSLRQFYIRRLLRIFPLYYLVLFLGTGWNFPGFREGFWWNFTYLTNVQYFLGMEHPGPNLSGHFWTLAIEEQFYLIWPFFIIFLPRRAVLPTIIAVILVSPLSSYIAYSNQIWRYFYLTPACLQFLGMGALVAATDFPEYALGLTRAMLERVFLRTSVPILILFAVLESAGFSAPWFSWLQLVLRGYFIAMFFAWLISRAARGFKGLTGKILSFSPITYLGKISYGLYVYHMLFVMVDGFLLRLAGTIAVTMLSWHLFEKPINDMKRRFPYSRQHSNQRCQSAIEVADET